MLCASPWLPVGFFFILLKLCSLTLTPGVRSSRLSLRLCSKILSPEHLSLNQNVPHTLRVCGVWTSSVTAPSTTPSLRSCEFHCLVKSLSGLTPDHLKVSLSPSMGAIQCLPNK